MGDRRHQTTEFVLPSVLERLSAADITLLESLAYGEVEIERVDLERVIWLLHYGLCETHIDKRDEITLARTPKGELARKLHSRRARERKAG